MRPPPTLGVDIVAEDDWKMYCGCWLLVTVVPVLVLVLVDDRALDDNECDGCSCTFARVFAGPGPFPYDEGWDCEGPPVGTANLRSTRTVSSLIMLKLLLGGMVLSLLAQFPF